MKKGRDGDKRWIGKKEVRKEGKRGEERKVNRGRDGERGRTTERTYRRDRNVLKVTDRVTNRQEADDRRKKPIEKEQTDGKGRKKTKKGKKETDKKAIKVKVKRDLWERHKEVRKRGKGGDSERLIVPTCY